MDFEILSPACNLDTILDGRGGIFTWYPKEPIVEYNMLYFKPGKARGFHYHPEFTEYMLVVDGQGTMVVKKEGEEKIIHLSKGISTELTIIAMLTKKWPDCDNPIIREEI